MTLKYSITNVYILTEKLAWNTSEYENIFCSTVSLSRSEHMSVKFMSHSPPQNVEKNFFRYLSWYLLLYMGNLHGNLNKK
jgi:hypothetical protein